MHASGNHISFERARIIADRYDYCLLHMTVSWPVRFFAWIALVFGRESFAFASISRWDFIRICNTLSTSKPWIKLCLLIIVSNLNVDHQIYCNENYCGCIKWVSIYRINYCLTDQNVLRELHH